MGEKLRGPMQEMMKAAGKAVIRMRAATYMPAMAQPWAGRDEPITEVVMDLAELSAAAYRTRGSRFRRGIKGRRWRTCLARSSLRSN